jgi:hypothetical protein
VKTDFFVLIADACVVILLVGECALPAAEEQHAGLWGVDGNVSY